MNEMYGKILSYILFFNNILRFFGISIDDNYNKTMDCTICLNMIDSKIHSCTYCNVVMCEDCLLYSCKIRLEERQLPKCHSCQRTYEFSVIASMNIMPDVMSNIEHLIEQDYRRHIELSQNIRSLHICWTLYITQDILSNILTDDIIAGMDQLYNINVNVFDKLSIPTPDEHVRLNTVEEYFSFYRSTLLDRLDDRPSYDTLCYCGGVLSDDNVCTGCNKQICRKCLTEHDAISLSNNSDRSWSDSSSILDDITMDYESSDHLCNDIELATIYKQDNKPCPGCLIPISKLEGCIDMYCTICETGFDWNTLELIKESYHNPHKNQMYGVHDEMTLDNEVYNPWYHSRRYISRVEFIFSYHHHLCSDLIYTILSSSVDIHAYYEMLFKGNNSLQYNGSMLDLIIKRVSSPDVRPNVILKLMKLEEFKLRKYYSNLIKGMKSNIDEYILMYGDVQTMDKIELKMLQDEWKVVTVHRLLQYYG